MQRNDANIPGGGQAGSSEPTVKEHGKKTAPGEEAAGAAGGAAGPPTLTPLDILAAVAAAAPPLPTTSTPPHENLRVDMDWAKKLPIPLMGALLHGVQNNAHLNAALASLTVQESANLYVYVNSLTEEKRKHMMEYWVGLHHRMAMDPVDRRMTEWFGNVPSIPREAGKRRQFLRHFLKMTELLDRDPQDFVWLAQMMDIPTQ